MVCLLRFGGARPLSGEARKTLVGFFSTFDHPVDLSKAQLAVSGKRGGAANLDCTAQERSCYPCGAYNPSSSSRFIGICWQRFVRHEVKVTFDRKAETSCHS